PHGAADRGDARPAARLCNRRPPGAGVQWRTPPQHGHALSRADAPRAARSRARRVGRYRQQPEGTVLRDHRCRTPAARERESRVGSHDVHHAHAPAWAAMTLESTTAALREWFTRLWGTLRGN